MTRLTVVTGWGPSGYCEYGKRFAETFAKHWPQDVDLVVYGEEPVELPRGEFRALSSIPACIDFLERNDNDVARGRKPREDRLRNWKASHIVSGYSFRFDAWKFCRQGFIPYAAAASCESEYLCWLDADVVTHADVPSGFIESLLPDGYDVAYLGRGDKHSEIGFQLYRRHNAMEALKMFKAYYNTDTVFYLKEWHSAYVFDTVRREIEGVRYHDLTPGGHGHVWHQSPLCKYTDHLKGNRKGRSRSPERVA